MGGDVVYFSGSVAFQVPLAFYVAFFFEKAEQRVYGAGPEVDAEVLAQARDYLVPVHRLRSQQLEDHGVKQPP